MPWAKHSLTWVEPRYYSPQDLGRVFLFYPRGYKKALKRKSKWWTDHRKGDSSAGRIPVQAPLKTTLEPDTETKVGMPAKSALKIWSDNATHAL